MSRNVRLLVILAVALVVLAGLFLLFQTEDSVAQDEAQVGDAIDLRHSVAELKSVHLRNQYDAFTVLCMEDGGYKIDGADALELDMEKLSGFIQRISALTFDALVEERPSDAGAYGFAEPSGEIGLSFEDGSTMRLELGAVSDVGVYARVDGEEAVYLLGPEWMYDLESEARYFVSTKVTGSLTGMVYERAEFGGAMRSEAIVVEMNPERALSGVDYIMRSPKEKTTAKAAGILVSLSDINAVEIAEIYPDEATLQKYSLTGGAHCVVTTVRDGKTTTYTASAPTPNGYFYMMTSNAPVIYYMSLSAMRQNDMPPYWYTSLYPDFLSAYIFHPIYELLSDIKVNAGGEEYAYSIDREGGQAIVKNAEGETLDAELFYNYFKSLATLPNNGYNTQEPVGAPLMRIEYSYADGRPDDIMEFFEKDARWMICAVNGDAEYLLERSYVELVSQEAQ